MDEELIAAVRSHVCLYDTEHPNYAKTKLKDSIWRGVARSLDYQDGNYAKRAWEKLRNNHRDALRRQRRMTVGKKWRYQSSMEFLLPYMKNRNLEGEYLTPANENQDRSQTDDQNFDVELHVKVEDEEEPNGDPLEEENQNSVPAARTAIRSRTWKKAELHTLHRKSLEMRERIKQRRLLSEDFTVRNAKNDPLFHFFMSMYESTKKMSPVAQYRVKNRVFRMISREEAKELNIERCSEDASPDEVSE